MTACLDAWALIALIEDEAAASTVAELVGSGGCVMSWINVGEVHYLQARRGRAHDVDRAIALLPAHMALIDATGPRVLRAAELKARVALSFADCFAATTAIGAGLPLATGDPGLLALAEPGLQVIDLRATAD